MFLIKYKLLQQGNMQICFNHFINIIQQNMHFNLLMERKRETVFYYFKLYFVGVGAGIITKIAIIINYIINIMVIENIRIIIIIVTAKLKLIDMVIIIIIIKVIIIAKLKLIDKVEFVINLNSKSVNN